MLPGAFGCVNLLEQVWEGKHVLNYVQLDLNFTALLLERNRNHILSDQGLELIQLNINLNFGILVIPRIFIDIDSVMYWTCFSFMDQLWGTTLYDTVAAYCLGSLRWEILTFVVMSIIIRILTLLIDGFFQSTLILIICK